MSSNPVYGLHWVSQNTSTKINYVIAGKINYVSPSSDTGWSITSAGCKYGHTNHSAGHTYGSFPWIKPDANFSGYVKVYWDHMHSIATTIDIPVFKINSIKLNQTTFKPGTYQLLAIVDAEGPDNIAGTFDTNFGFSKSYLRVSEVSYSKRGEKILNLDYLGRLTISQNYRKGDIANDQITIKTTNGLPMNKKYEFTITIEPSYVSSVSVFPNGSQVTAGSTRSDRFIVSNTGSISKILTWINKKFKKLKEYLNRKGEIKWKLIMPSYI